MANVYIYNYNNYYNRILKKFNDIDSYEPYQIGVFSEINFIPNDGITTTQVINVASLSDIPDYLIVTDENNPPNIMSRWYIMEAVKTSYSQYKLNLLRDVLADWSDAISEAPCYVEKGFVGLNDTAIYNVEDIKVNQIKTSETLLKDNTGCPWIVAYIARNMPDTTVTVPYEEIKVDYTGFENYQYHKYSIENYYGPVKTADITQLIGFKKGLSIVEKVYLYWDGFTGGTGTISTKMSKKMGKLAPYMAYHISKDNPDTIQGEINNYTRDDLKGLILNKYKSIFEESYPWNTLSYNSLWGEDSNSNENIVLEDGKIIENNGKYYKIKVKRNGYEYRTVRIDDTEPNFLLAINTPLAKILNDEDENLTGRVVWDDVGGIIYMSASSYRIEYEETSIRSLRLSLASNHAVLNEEPYDMLCAPYGEIEQGSAGVRSNPNVTMRIAGEMIKTLGSNLYDIQLLPYCPLDNVFIQEEGKIDHNYFPSYTEGEGVHVQPIISYISSEQQEVMGYYYWCTSNKITRTIEKNISISDDAIEFKVQNQCDMYRLVSPNYNGQFEFTATRNNGAYEFNISCTYKPQTPYIRVAPNFGGLYGQDFNDARGLICGGDFSLATLSDAWIQYQIQNKNYANIFDRQIQNLEFMQGQERIEAVANLITGIVQGTATGAMAGSVGGVYGAIAGGVVGGVSSLVGGIVDYSMLDARQKETLDFTKDQFNYSLQNIKALPYNLTRVSAYNSDNKIFPMIEYYTATEIEKEAVRDKIRYNGMTINRIGKLADFIGPKGTPVYVKGRLIRLEGIADEYHTALQIAIEVNKGFYV